jgi:Uncharacterized protein conserved in bacteria (DUF2331).
MPSSISTSNEADSELRDTVVHFWTAWNRGLDLAPAWLEFVSSLPALQRHALKWSRSLQTQADLASQLVDEVQQLASNRPSLAPAR